jgi:hypothetical protein
MGILSDLQIDDFGLNGAESAKSKNTKSVQNIVLHTLDEF